MKKLFELIQKKRKRLPRRVLQGHSVSTHEASLPHCDIVKLSIKNVLNKSHYRLSAYVCCIWALPTCHSTIWPDIDLAHTTDPLERLGRVETQLKHHEAILASTAADVRQAAANQEQGFATLAPQVLQLTNAFLPGSNSTGTDSAWSCLGVLGLGSRALRW